MCRCGARCLNEEHAFTNQGNVYRPSLVRIPSEANLRRARLDLRRIQVSPSAELRLTVDFVELTLRRIALEDDPAYTQLWLTFTSTQK